MNCDISSQVSSDVAKQQVPANYFNDPLFFQILKKYFDSWYGCLGHFCTRFITDKDYYIITNIKVNFSDLYTLRT